MAGSEFVVLFGDELAEVSTGRLGVGVASGQKVSARDLAAMLQAVAVAQLVGLGAASLQAQDKKKLFRTTRGLALSVQPAGDGFTRLVAQAAATGEARRLALGLLGGKVESPEMRLIGMAQAILEPTGAAVAAGGLGGHLRAAVGMPFKVDQQRAGELRPDWLPVKQAWDSFVAGDAAMASLLVDECRKGLGDAREYRE